MTPFPVRPLPPHSESRPFGTESLEYEGGQSSARLLLLVVFLPWLNFTMKIQIVNLYGLQCGKYMAIIIRVTKTLTRLRIESGGESQTSVSTRMRPSSFILPETPPERRGKRCVKHESGGD